MVKLRSFMPAEEQVAAMERMQKREVDDRLIDSIVKRVMSEQSRIDAGSTKTNGFTVGAKVVSGAHVDPAILESLRVSGETTRRDDTSFTVGGKVIAGGA